MNNLKFQALTAIVLYIILFLGAPLSNPLIALNIAEAVFMALLIICGFGLSYLLLSTNKVKLASETKSTIISLYIVLMAFISFYNPVNFPSNYNIQLGNIIALPLLIVAAIIFYLWVRTINTSMLVLLIFLPSLVQGILMRVSQKALIFYLTNPNFSTYLIFIFAIIYYGFRYIKNK